MPPSVVTRPSWAKDAHDDPEALPPKVEEVLQNHAPRPASRFKRVLDAMDGEPSTPPALIAFRSGLSLVEVERTLADLERRGRLPKTPLGQPSPGTGVVPPGALVRGRTPAQWLAYDREARAAAELPPWRPGASFRAWRESR